MRIAITPIDEENAMPFVSNDAFTNSGLLAAGEWQVTSSVEGQLVSQVSFRAVPEPSSLALLGLGLLAVGYRRVKNS